MAVKLAEFADPDSCLMKAADDEPLFVLRAQDKFAPALVRLWAGLVMLEQRHQVRTTKIMEAENLADDMERWQQETGRVKCPDCSSSSWW
jgi:hypothetical protein